MRQSNAIRFFVAHRMRASLNEQSMGTGGDSRAQKESENNERSDRMPKAASLKKSLSATNKSIATNDTNSNNRGVHQTQQRHHHYQQQRRRQQDKTRSASTMTNRSQVVTFSHNDNHHHSMPEKAEAQEAQQHVRLALDAGDEDDEDAERLLRRSRLSSSSLSLPGLEVGTGRVAIPQPP